MTRTKTMNSFNIQVAEGELEQVGTEVGLSLLDLANVAQVLKAVDRDGTLAPLIHILEDTAHQLAAVGGLLVGAQAEREALREERDNAIEALAQLQYSLETWNQSHPLVAALVRSAYETGQQDLLAQMNLSNEGRAS